MKIYELPSGLSIVQDKSPTKEVPPPPAPKKHCYTYAIRSTDLPDALHSIFCLRADLISCVKCGEAKDILSSSQYMLTYVHTHELGFMEKC